MATAPPFPRASGGAVLYPGTKVLLHSLKACPELNGQEAICEHWDSASGRIHVALQDGTVKALRPMNLQKVVEKEQDVEDDPNFQKVLQIFQRFDTNGDGVIDSNELGVCLKTLGLGEKCLPAFLQAVDKSGDLHIQYEEFVRWVMAPGGKKTQKSNLDVYWPEHKKREVEVHAVDEDDDEPDDLKQYTDEDVERIIGELPAGWPPHGCQILNNMRARFPDMPIEGIIWSMERNDYVGGKVIAALRATGTCEVDTVPPSAVKVGKPGAFPATYRVRTRPMEIYTQGNRAWSFQNMRDRKMESIAELPPEAHFEVLEVRRGNEFGYCFGRVKGPSSLPGACWVVLGLEVDRSHWTNTDARRGLVDLNFTEAERVEE